MTAHDPILVTGGAGFVGAHFVHRAHRAGRRVVALDDLSGGPMPVLPPEVTFVRGDIGDRELVAHLLRTERIGAVVHFAGRIQVGESVRDPAPYFEANVVRTLALLDVLLAQGPAVFVFSSSAAVYGASDLHTIPETAALAPTSPYGASKLAMELALRAYGSAYGLRWAALRYFNAAGAQPGLREAHEPETHLLPLAIDAATGRRPPLTVFGDDYATRDGTCERDYVHVVDLADAHLAALDHLAAGGSVGALNLGSGRGVTVREAIAAVGARLGRPVPHAVGPRREGDPARLVADVTRAAALLGWAPVRSDLVTLVDDAIASRGARALGLGVTPP